MGSRRVSRQSLQSHRPTAPSRLAGAQAQGGAAEPNLPRHPGNHRLLSSGRSEPGEGFFCAQRAERSQTRTGARRGHVSGGRKPDSLSTSTRPREIKSAVVGYGHATKEQVQKMVDVAARVFAEDWRADAADALAAAICHVHRQAFQARIVEAASRNKQTAMARLRGAPRAQTIGAAVAALKTTIARRDCAN